jgi:hypothetical protein
MTPEIISSTVDLVGKVMISYTAIAVHTRFRKEHKIDDQVFKEMKREQYIGIAGIALIVGRVFD